MSLPVCFSPGFKSVNRAGVARDWQINKDAKRAGKVNLPSSSSFSSLVLDGAHQFEDEDEHEGRAGSETPSS